jgi:hypothetical protein
MNSMKDKRRTSTRPPATKSRINLIIYIVSALVVVAISVCCLGIIYFKYKGNGTPTPSAPMNISTIIASTSIAAQKQTMAAIPVASSTMVIPPSVTLAPSFTPIPSNTPFIVATLGKMTPVIIVPTSPPKVSCCVYCSGNLPQPCGNQCLPKYDLCTVPANAGCACKK